jgi:hypothetical protein
VSPCKHGLHLWGCTPVPHMLGCVAYAHVWPMRLLLKYRVQGCLVQGGRGGVNQCPGSSACRGWLLYWARCGLQALPAVTCAGSRRRCHNQDCLNHSHAATRDNGTAASARRFLAPQTAQDKSSSVASKGLHLGQQRNWVCCWAYCGRWGSCPGCQRAPARHLSAQRLWLAVVEYEAAGPPCRAP